MIKLGGLVSSNPFKPTDTHKNTIMEQSFPKEAFLDFAAKDYDNTKGISYVRNSYETIIEELDYMIKIYVKAIEIDKEQHDGNMVSKLSKDVTSIAKAKLALNNIKIK